MQGARQQVQFILRKLRRLLFVYRSRMHWRVGRGWRQVHRKVRDGMQSRSLLERRHMRVRRGWYYGECDVSANRSQHCNRYYRFVEIYPFWLRRCHFSLFENLRRKLISSVSNITGIGISQPRRNACVRIEIGRTPYLNEFVDVDSAILPKRGSATFNERRNRFFPVLRVHIPRFDVIQKNLAKLEKRHFRKTYAFFS